MNATEGRIDVVLREFGRLLLSLGSELGQATRDAERQCLPLGQMFDRVAAANHQITACVRDTSSAAPVLAHCAEISQALSTAVVTLQYGDRLAQRIGHVRSGLEHLNSLLQSYPSRSYEESMAFLQDVELMQALQQERLLPPESGQCGTSELF